MAGDDETGSENDQGAGAALRLNLALPNQNVVAAAKHYAEKKHLRAHQLTELNAFLKVGLVSATLLLPILLFFFAQGTCLAAGGQAAHQYFRFWQPTRADCQI
jgi:hypothetical protein